MCVGDDTGLTVATNWLNVGATSASCTVARKCEYYTPVALNCSGTAPVAPGQVMCVGDNTGLVVATSWLNVGATSASCTAARKCEYYTCSPAPICSVIDCSGLCGQQESICTSSCGYDCSANPTACDAQDVDCGSCSSGNWVED